MGDPLTQGIDDLLELPERGDSKKGKARRRKYPTRKFFTWFDISRILKKMSSPSLNNLSRRDDIREYYACLGAYLRMCYHFKKVAKSAPWLLFRQKQSEKISMLNAIGQAALTAAETTVEFYESYSS